MSSSQQANVGCSVGCRCEGCKNGFGIKGGKFDMHIPHISKIIHVNDPTSYK